jgi:hypothetical protein
VRHSRDEQKARNRWTQRKFIEKLGARFQRAGGKVKIQVIGEDGKGGVFADQDHEDALDQVQESHDQVEALQSGKRAIRYFWLPFYFILLCREIVN